MDKTRGYAVEVSHPLMMIGVWGLIHKSAKKFKNNLSTADVQISTSRWQVFEFS
jgi:hypothetical protein